MFFSPRDTAVCAMSRSQRSEPTPEPGGRAIIIIIIIMSSSSSSSSSTTLWKRNRILACLFRPSRSTYSQDVCEQLRPTCSINLPCHDMYKCSCPSCQSNFKTLFGHCFSLGRRGNHVRVRACDVRSECKKYDWL